MAQQFEDIVIVDLDVQKTTWSRVHSAMRTLYLKLNRDPDIAWTKFFFEERNSRVELKRHGLWIEDGYVVFDCLLIDVDNHHLPDIRQSIAYANERSRELQETQRIEREQLKAKARDEAAVLKALRAKLRDEREGGESADAPATSVAEPAPEPETAQSLEEAAQSQLLDAADAAPDAAAEPQPQRAPDPAPAGAAEPQPEPELQLAPEPATHVPTVEPAVVPPPAPPLEPEPVKDEEASEIDLQLKRNDWRARFRAAFERNKN